jgi:hypothetical protein
VQWLENLHQHIHTLSVTLLNIEMGLKEGDKNCAATPRPFPPLLTLPSRPALWYGVPDRLHQTPDISRNRRRRGEHYCSGGRRETVRRGKTSSGRCLCIRRRNTAECQCPDLGDDPSHRVLGPIYVAFFRRGGYLLGSPVSRVRRLVCLGCAVCTDQRSRAKDISRNQAFLSAT